MQIDKATKGCINWIRDFFHNTNGDFAIIGISGGKDSTVAAALCAEALGKDNVIGVTMPDGIQNDIKDSYKIIEYLGIKSIEANIHNAVEDVKKSLHLNNRIEGFGIKKQAEINLPPRIRMSTLYFIAQCLSPDARVVNTCNLSEDFIGYSTRWGDSVGDFCPLSNFTSEEVIEIGRYLKLPEDLLVKAPSDGLCGKTDEDNLGFTYHDLNKLIKTYDKPEESGLDSELKEKMLDMHFKNIFKIHMPVSYKYEE